MPAAAPINPVLIRSIFDYESVTGNLIPKPAAKNVAYKTARNQWAIGQYRYSLHRLVWAWHNPDNPNPRYITFKDSMCNNTRIENLHAQDVHPRWVGHKKQRKAKLDADGNITYIEEMFDSRFNYQ
jgi:hypothetical protein